MNPGDYYYWLGGGSGTVAQENCLLLQESLGNEGLTLKYWGRCKEVDGRRLRRKRLNGSHMLYFISIPLLTQSTQWRIFLWLCILSFSAIFTVPLHGNGLSGDSAISREYLRNTWGILGCANNARELLLFRSRRSEILYILLFLYESHATKNYLTCSMIWMAHHSWSLKSN